MFEQARAHGFLGPRPVIEQARHALAFLAAPTDEPQQAVDLGSGGGIPGLVLARHGWPGCRWLLLEAGARRSDFLRQAVTALRLEDRVEVVQGRAEEMGRDPQRRHVADLVVARSFGPPAVTAECAAPLVAVGGMVVVSEPPVVVRRPLAERRPGARRAGRRAHDQRTGAPGGSPGPGRLPGPLPEAGRRAREATAVLTTSLLAGRRPVKRAESFTWNRNDRLTRRRGSGEDARREQHATARRHGGARAGLARGPSIAATPHRIT